MENGIGQHQVCSSMCIAKYGDPFITHTFRLSLANLCSLLAGTTSLFVLLAARQQRVGGPTKRAGGPDHQQRPRRTSEQPHRRFLACCSNRGQLDSLSRLILALCKVSLQWSCLCTLIHIGRRFTKQSWHACRRPFDEPQGFPSDAHLQLSKRVFATFSRL